MESLDAERRIPLPAGPQAPEPANGAPPTWRDALRELSPAYFGLVMATGIVSLASDMMGHTRIAQALFVLNIVQYVALWAAYLLRMWQFPRRFFGDMTDHAKGPGYFTLVAATCILASQFILLHDDVSIGLAMWVLAVALWFALTYTIFMAFTVKAEKPPLDRSISGAWLLAVVSTQALAVSSALLAARIGQPFRLELNLVALSMWLWGGMLYIWMMSLIFYRYTFFPFSPADLSPPYWINMGAMAISTLAGSLLILNTPHAPFLNSMLPFLKGFTVFYWATGTWWIPMLLVLAVWRHLVRRFPFAYDPMYWGAVFPLGMYAVSTLRMIDALHLPFLAPLPQLMFAIGMLAWCLLFLGQLRALPRHWRATRTRTSRRLDPDQ